MTLSTNILQRGLISVLLGICLVMLSNPVFSQATTSQMKVVVADESGTGVGGVSVRITHIPTERSKISTSKSNYKKQLLI